MKQNYFLLLLFCSQLFFSQIINFPDPKFKARLLESSTTNYYNMVASDLNGNPTVIDQNQDGEIDVQEALNISKISIDGSNSPLNYIQFSSNKYFNIDSIEGINYFKNLKILECKNNNLNSIDFKDLGKLEQIYCQNNKITTFLNFGAINKLYVMNCSSNLLTNLDFSQSAKNIDFSSSVYDNRGFVSYGYYGNPLINLNLQCGFKTTWAMLSDLDLCPFYYFYGGMISTCFHVPEKIPTLINLTVNCFESDFYKSFATNGNMSANVTDNCLIATEETKKIKLTISPNPTKDFLKLNINEKIDKIEIYDESGRLVLSPSVGDNSINVSKLKSGIYHLKILINDKSQNIKFVKQ